MHTLYEITSKRGQPLYKGQNAGSQLCPLLFWRFHCYFLQKMVELYKDPKGEKIFSKTSTSMNLTGMLDVPVKSGEVDTLRKRIKNLEMKLKEQEASISIYRGGGDWP